jgi:hypothetical protein
VLPSSRRRAAVHVFWVGKENNNNYRVLQTSDNQKLSGISCAGTKVKAKIQKRIFYACCGFFLLKKAHVRTSLLRQFEKGAQQFVCRVEFDQDHIAGDIQNG